MKIKKTKLVLLLKTPILCQRKCIKQFGLLLAPNPTFQTIQIWPKRRRVTQFGHPAVPKVAQNAAESGPKM